MTTQIRFTDEQLAGIGVTLSLLEDQLDVLVGLPIEERRRLFKMGRKSESFCRKALTVLDQNRQIVPTSLQLDKALDDLGTIDQLRPMLKRIQRLEERMLNSEITLGANVAAAARKGYALLRVAGKDQGLEGQRGELAQRFKRKSRRKRDEEENQQAA